MDPIKAKPAQTRLTPLHIALLVLALGLLVLPFVGPWWTEAAVVGAPGTEELRETRLDRGPIHSLSSRFMTANLMCGVLMIVMLIWRRRWRGLFLTAWLLAIMGVSIAYSPPISDPLAAIEYNWPYWVYLMTLGAYWLLLLALSAFAIADMLKRKSGE